MGQWDVGMSADDVVIRREEMMLVHYDSNVMTTCGFVIRSCGCAAMMMPSDDAI